MKRNLKRFFAVMLLLAFMIPQSVSAAGNTEELSLMIQETAASMKLSYNAKGKTILSDAAIFPPGDPGSDWVAMTFAFAGMEEAYDDYLNQLEKYVVEKYKKQGYLENIKATEYHRIALTMYALGGNPENIKYGNESIHLINDGTFGFHSGSPGMQGTNGLIYALLAADAKHSKEPENTANSRQSFVDGILACQDENGAFALDQGFEGDIDITAMALQALAPYSQQETVNTAIESALIWISEQLTDDCMLISYGSESAESLAQTILALCALGIDPEEDERFIRNGRTLLDGLNSFRTEGGLYYHSKSDAEYSMLSTYQSLLALEAVERFRTDGSWILDFTDYTAPESVDTNNPYLWIAAGGIAVLAAVIFILLKSKKKTA